MDFLTAHGADLLFVVHALASFTRVIASAASPITTAATSIVQIGSLGNADFMIVPITVAMLVVLFLLILSYRQTIKEYPTAGGASVDAHDFY